MTLSFTLEFHDSVLFFSFSVYIKLTELSCSFYICFPLWFPSATRCDVRSVIGWIHGTRKSGKIIAKAVAVSVMIMKPLIFFPFDFDS